jgi:hypothetical protein
MTGHPVIGAADAPASDPFFMGQDMMCQWCLVAVTIVVVTQGQRDDASGRKDGVRSEKRDDYSVLPEHAGRECKGKVWEEESRQESEWGNFLSHRPSMVQNCVVVDAGLHHHITVIRSGQGWQETETGKGWKLSAKWVAI